MFPFLYTCYCVPICYKICKYIFFLFNSYYLQILNFKAKIFNSGYAEENNDQNSRYVCILCVYVCKESKLYDMYVTKDEKDLFLYIVNISHIRVNLTFWTRMF